MSGFKLTSDTLDVVPGAGSIEYNGQFFGTDANNSRAQMGRLVHETAKSATGTAVDFTGIPAWAKRITVMLSGVSGSGTSNLLLQLGSGSIDALSYISVASAGGSAFQSTTGFALTYSIAAAVPRNGHAVITNISSNSWVQSGMVSTVDTTLVASLSGGSKTLSATLDRIRITTVNGTDTFDAGSINILYEG